MQESISAPQVGGIVRLTRFILTTAFLIEGVGALLLALRFCPQIGSCEEDSGTRCFTQCPSFCNAGFDLMGVGGYPVLSLTGYVGDPLVSNVIACGSDRHWRHRLPHLGMTCREHKLPLSSATGCRAS